MRPGVWSYVLGGIGALGFLGTAYFYGGAGAYVPVWASVILWLAWAGLLAFTVYLMRMSPAWVLAMPVLSLLALAMLLGILEFIVLMLVS